MDCIFCKIGAGEIPAKEVYRDAGIVAIEDINAQAPVHLLVLPIAHYQDVGALVDAHDDVLLAELMCVASDLGRERGGDGYRLVVNSGPDGGQTVAHLHIHVLAGRALTWPPG
jgi:histidine triad (HIT) family protein